VTPAPTTRPPSLDLGLQTWPAIDRGEVLLLVPVGAVEQHGPHLPLATDAVVAAAVARHAAETLTAQGKRVLVAPALAYGASGEHEGFPGTISIGHEALRCLLVEFARSACRWASGTIFVNGHGGNVPTLKRAVEQLRIEGRAVAWTSCDLVGSDAHAGRTETSLLLHLTPSAVRLEEAVSGCSTPLAEILPRLRAEGIRAVAPSGVLGDPAGSGADEGRELFRTLVQNLVAELLALDVTQSGRLAQADAAREPVRS